VSTDESRRVRTHSHVGKCVDMEIIETAKGLNTVHVIGRLGQQSQIKEMPSGDEITTFTVVVPRSGKLREGSPRVDSLACQSMRVGIRNKVLSWEPGSWVEVEGTLRRRFWQGGHGLASATEIEVRTMVRVRESTGVER
jgi:single-strand DNA-binding protein